MMAFLDAFHLREWNGLKRDWFNQRAFNKCLGGLKVGSIPPWTPTWNSWQLRLVLEWVNAGHVKAVL